MVTVGKGIFEIGAGFSVKHIDTGFSFHLNEMCQIDKPQKNTDNPNAIIHQILILFRTIF